MPVFLLKESPWLTSRERTFGTYVGLTPERQCSSASRVNSIFQNGYNQGLVQTRKDFLVPWTDIPFKETHNLVCSIYNFLRLGIPGQAKSQCDAQINRLGDRLERTTRELLRIASMISPMGNTQGLAFVRVKTKLSIFTPFLQCVEVVLKLFLVIFMVDNPVNLAVICKQAHA